MSYFWRKNDFSICSDKSLEPIAEGSISSDFSLELKLSSFCVILVHGSSITENMS